MRPIKITSKNATKISDALRAVNGRARSMTICEYYQVNLCVIGCENRLAATGLPKKERVGATATCRPAGPSSGYKYDAKSTFITLERRATGWFLTDIETATVYPGNSEHEEITVTAAQADEIQRRALAPFRVLETVAA